MGWLQQHLEEFVKPVLGYVPELGKDYSRSFTPQEMAVIKNMWRSVKQEARRVNRPILLAGRDVWIFEVLARREGTPTVFRPDISRLAADYVTEDYSDYFLFDTGFMGSIPRALHCKSYVMGSATYTNAGMQSIRRNQHVMLRTESKQVFPRMKGSRSLILKIERTPKYWRRAFYRGACIYCSIMPGHCANRYGIIQDQSSVAEFALAAQLTIQIYKDTSPRFLNSPVQVTEHTDAMQFLD